MHYLVLWVPNVTPEGNEMERVWAGNMMMSGSYWRILQVFLLKLVKVIRYIYCINVLFRCIGLRWCSSNNLMTDNLKWETKTQRRKKCSLVQTKYTENVGHWQFTQTKIKNRCLIKVLDGVIIIYLFIVNLITWIFVHSRDLCNVVLAYSPATVLCSDCWQRVWKVLCWLTLKSPLLGQPVMSNKSCEIFITGKLLAKLVRQPDRDVNRPVFS